MERPYKVKSKQKMPKNPRINIPKSVKQYIFQRDKYQCQSCGKTNKEAKLNIDHIIPLAKGGSNDISNLQTLCSSCNQKKKHHFDSRFRRSFEGIRQKKTSHNRVEFRQG